MMELTETEKQRLETTNQYLPITMYNAIMLLMENEKYFNMKTTCENFSISLYNSMMILMGKEEHINMRRTAFDVKDKIYNEACSKYKCRVNTGSRKEGFMRYFTDIDLFFYPTRHRVVWSLTEMHIHDPSTESVILAEVHPSIPGTVYLCLKGSFSNNNDIINRVKLNHSCRNMYNRHNGIIQYDEPKSFNCGGNLQMALHVGNGLCKQIISLRDVGNLNGQRKILLKTWCRLGASLHRLSADSHAMTMTLTVIKNGVCRLYKLNRY